ncbi:uncharacterized protein LOC111410731 isoform X2 [Olea europaea var. sylvestris]|uniref:YTH domain-containing family protein n=1 Tax=Olea europaea subsp. europaea TaxID=158383 RepID=A0A8S0T0X2_OLEEU|nr:uncharacterized protein LOC111410731 isoform X2 [Olea europaea var. sylvestris]CAA2998540.1 YTH domain-containing family 1 [Olea europaea subsp. europaea]
MTGEKNVENAEPIAPGPSSDSSIDQSGKDMVFGKDELPSASVSLAPSIEEAASGIKGIVIDQTSGLEQGYNGNIAQSDEKGYFNTAGGSYKGIQSVNSSLLYYMPGYGPYGSDAFPCYTYDSNYAGNGSSGPAAKSGTIKSMMGPSGSGKSIAFNSTKSNNNISSKASSLNWNPREQQPASNFSNSIRPTQPLEPLNKLGSGFRSTALPNGFQPVGKFSSFANRNTGGFMHYGPVNYQSTGRVWNNNNGYKSRENFRKNGEFGASTELTRGPRANNRCNSTQLSAEVEQPGLAIPRDKYNLQEFQIQYAQAKFYVIKSYSEDDIHKCIKYEVWSSTPNGNKKLDAALRDANATSSESGAKCPVFLFFSVNASGQFIGVAEMTGQVDFNKNMDFWQLDKWNGFFPVKWHIIKDVPNIQLNHITLENNDNRSVTYTRDTQEIGLKQGLEMLSIFKNYSEKTSILEDFNFYENREKLLKAKRNAKPASETRESHNHDSGKHVKGWIG